MFLIIKTNVFLVFIGGLQEAAGCRRRQACRGRLLRYLVRPVPYDCSNSRADCEGQRKSCRAQGRRR